MERLTDKNHNPVNKCGEYSSCYSCHKETCYITELAEKLGELEDVLEKYGIDNLEEYISALIEARNIAIKEKKENIEEEKNLFKDYIEEIIKREKLEQELAEIKSKMIVPKEDRFVTVKNWKYKKYGIARVRKVLRDEYMLETDYIGTYEPCIKYDEFATKEEAEHKLAEIRGEKDE